MTAHGLASESANLAGNVREYLDGVSGAAQGIEPGTQWRSGVGLATFMPLSLWGRSESR